MPKKAPPEIANARRKAARLVPMVSCQRCEATQQLQRHHKDRNPKNNDLSNIEVLCQKCHFDEHRSDGTWGRGQIHPVPCKVCGKSFLPMYNGKGCTVCSAECHREWGRICVTKRWEAYRAREAA